MLGEDGRAAVVDYAQRTGLPAFTPNTLSSPAKLFANINQSLAGAMPWTTRKRN